MLTIAESGYWVAPDAQEDQPTSRTGHTAVAVDLPEGPALVVTGGAKHKRVLGDTYVLDLTSGVWSQSKVTPGFCRHLCVYMCACECVRLSLVSHCNLNTD
jgi:hypothetical protein